MENIHENGTFQLHNKVEIPQVGFGTWQMPDGETAADAVMHAIEAGYTHIDTAAVYHNEIGVGAGIRMSGVPREKLFVTSKLWNVRSRRAISQGRSPESAVLPGIQR